MGARAVTKGIQKNPWKKSHSTQGSNGPDHLPAGKGTQVLLRHFNDTLDLLETIIRGMHRTAWLSLGCALVPKLARMRGWVESTVASPQSGRLLHETLLYCVVESEQMLNLLECVLGSPQRRDH